MTPTALTTLLLISLAFNAALFMGYRRERERRSLVGVCLGLPPYSDWWPIYYRLHKSTQSYEGDN